MHTLSPTKRFIMTYPVTIGHSKVKVNPLGLGTNAVGGYNLFPDLDD